MAKSYVARMLGEHERIILITRQHWFVLVRSIFVELVVMAAVVILAALAFILLVVLHPVWYLVVLVAAILLLVPLIGMIRDFMFWYNREYIITNRRVIQIDGVFNKDVTDSSLDKVNDVKMDQSFLGRIFGYGDIEILTASELGVNLFRRIGDPIRFKTAMLNAKEELEHGGFVQPFPAPMPPSTGPVPVPGRVAPAPQGNDDIPALIAQLDNLRQRGILTEAEFQNKKAELLKKM